MGRVVLLASLSTILLISNANGLAAQGRAGGAANSGSVGAGASGAMHGSAMAVAPAPRAAGHVTSSPGSHLAIPRSANGQIMPRRASTIRGTGRLNGSASARARQLRSRGGVGTDFSNDSNVPGLGFDAVHVAATRGNRSGGRRDGQGRGSEFGVLFPFFGGGGYYVPTGSDLIGDAQGDGQVIDDAEDQGPGPDDHAYDRADRPARMGNVNRPPVEQPGPQVNAPEYVFVRRDGTVFFAVAYSWENGSLRYISSEGMRRSVSRDTLDLNATQQFNEQRGMTFRSPAA
jgi:hypothetical protein